MDLWSSTLGFLLGLAANKFSERWALLQAHRGAKRLAGEWVAYNKRGRSIDTQPMPGAGLTVISARPWWRSYSYVLDVRAQDVSPEKIRNHHGWIAIDPSRPQRATRTIFYDDCDEVGEQRLLISDDRNTLHVVDESAGGGYSPAQALRRRSTGVILNSMAHEPGAVSVPPATKDEKAILADRRRYALVFFVLSCVWFVGVAVLLCLNGKSVVYISDPVLIAAITTIPALFVIFRFVLPDTPARPHFVNLERVPVKEPAEETYRVIDPPPR